MKTCKVMNMETFVNYCILTIIWFLICIGCGKKTPVSDSLMARGVDGKWYYILHIRLESEALTNQINLDDIKKPFTDILGADVVRVERVSKANLYPASKVPNYHSIRVHLDSSVPVEGLLTSHDAVGYHDNDLTNDSLLRPYSVQSICEARSPPETKCIPMTNAAVTLHEICHYWNKDHIEDMNSVLREDVNSHRAMIHLCVERELSIPLKIPSDVADKIKASLLVKPQPCLCGHSIHLKPGTSKSEACKVTGCTCRPCPNPDCDHASHFITAGSKQITTCPQPDCTCTPCKDSRCMHLKNKHIGGSGFCTETCPCHNFIE